MQRVARFGAQLEDVLGRVPWILVAKLLLWGLFGYAAFLFVTLIASENAIHTDNQYNHGLVARSAIDDSPYPLVTSYLHWYFYDVEAVRAEDWHRSVYLVLLTEIRSLFGDTAILYSRVVYAVICLIFLWLTAVVARGVVRSASVTSLDLRYCFGLTAVVLIINGWMPEVLASEYMDDMPAAVFLLAAAAIVVLKGIGGWVTMAVAVLAACAFYVKGLSLVVAAALFCSVLCIAVLERSPGWLARSVSRACLFLATYLAAIIPKLYWNYIELGMYLPEQARLGLNGRLKQDVFDGEHTVYFLKPEIEVPHSWLQVMIENGFLGEIWTGFGATLAALLHAWSVLLVVAGGLAAAAVARRRVPLSPRFLRLCVLFAVSLLAFCAFFTLRLGEPGQIRYWLIPFALGTALGLAGFTAFFRSFPCDDVCRWCKAEISRRLALKTGRSSLRFFETRLPTLRGMVAKWPSSERIFRDCRYLALGVVFIVGTVATVEIVLSVKAAKPMWSDEVWYPEEATQRLTDVAGTGAVFLHTNTGTNYWIEQPMSKVVGMRSPEFITLSSEQLRTMVERYDVRAALYKDRRRKGGFGWANAVRYLESHGFCRDSTYGSFVVLVWHEALESDADCPGVRSYPPHPGSSLASEAGAAQAE
ncbi:MAG: hypothetical protein Kilf2KO_46600 [Rhodospirillales bacterium]